MNKQATGATVGHEARPTTRPPRVSNAITRLILICAIGAVFTSGLPRDAQAEAIKVIDQGVDLHGQVIAAKAHLTALGHTLTTGGTLLDYSAFDQVWDLRYNSNLGASDITAMGNFLAGGGCMYLTGEHNGFDTDRNNSLVNWVNSIGAGSLVLTGAAFSDLQPITPAGQIVNSPNAFAAVSYASAQITSSAGSGFLVTESSAGQGSLVGWNFGDISGKPGARMLIGLDIEIFNNGQDWTENMATYLGVPEPTALSLALIALPFIGRRRRKRT